MSDDDETNEDPINGAKDNLDIPIEDEEDLDVPDSNDDGQRGKTVAKNRSPPPPIACTSRLVRSCAIKSQKQISDYYRKK